EQGEGQQAVARRMVRALRLGLLVGVDGQLQAALVATRAQALQPLAGEAAQVRPPGEEVDERAVGARRRSPQPRRLPGLAQRDQPEHVPRVRVMPGSRRLYSLGAL